MYRIKKTVKLITSLGYCDLKHYTKIENQSVFFLDTMFSAFSWYNLQNEMKIFSFQNEMKVNCHTPF